MRDYQPEVLAYVEGMIFAWLSSPRSSGQLEGKYKTLSRQTKGATTVELRELSNRAAVFILENVSDMAELGNLDNDTLVREALLRALPEDD